MSKGNSPEKLNKIIEQEYSQSQNNDSLVCQGRWTIQEHKQFLLGVIKCGRDWKKVNEFINTRNSTQIRSHAQKYFLKLMKQQKQIKKCKSKSKNLLGQLQKQLLENFTFDDFTKETPNQFINIIKKVQGKDFITFEDDKSVQKQKFDKKIFNKKDNKEKETTQNKIIQTMENQIQQVQQQSYLMRTLYFQYRYRKKNPNCLKQGHEFYELIDFGRQTIMISEQNETPIRKRSFTLPEENHDQQKLKYKLSPFRRRMDYRD